jgi:hypothetical protein
MGHRASGMGHRAWGIGHGALFCGGLPLSDRDSSTTSKINPYHDLSHFVVEETFFYKNCLTLKVRFERGLSKIWA